MISASSSPPSHGRRAGAGLGFACPACLGALAPGEVPGWTCARCGREFPEVAGLPDLRLEPDRYLALAAERAKAARLAEAEAGTDLMGLAHAYYAITDDVDGRRRGRYLAHIARAESRGEALAALLPRRGCTLEVGCGTGGLLVAAARSGREVVGVEIALRWLVIARRRLADRGLAVPLVAASAWRLPWEEGRFDAVVADSVLEHLDDPAAALREWRRVLRPGGRLVVWGPNRFSLAPDPHVGLWGAGWLPDRLAARYVRWRRGCAWTVRPLSARAARRLAEGAGFERVRVGPPDLPRSWGRGRVERLALRLYGAARGWTPAARLLAWGGPLWQLTATRGAA